MSDRFFLEGEPQGTRAILAGDDARHLARVLRARVGDEVIVFSGTGCEWPARVAHVTRDAVTLELGLARVDPPPQIALALAVALPKGDRQKWLVEKLTELGVGRLVPLQTQRGVAEATPAVLERLKRTVIEACKQSGRNTLMELGRSTTPGELVAGASAATRLVLATRDGPPLVMADRDRATPTLGLVGPEGGFTMDELALFTGAGALPARLGPHVLRVETAAIALAAAMQPAR
jgi:16S rRNA (uracil1498-N3)-methyltransferase